MFRESYQSGKAVEILNPKDKNFKHGKSMQPLYDQTAKSYVFSLETHMSKISLPSNENEKLGLVQPYLILQLFVPGSHNFSFELKITDRSGSKRRLLFTTATKDLVINPLNCRIPTEIQKNTWINLCVNIESFANFYFGNTGYRSLDNITIFAYCKLRNVFTLRNTILDCSTNSYEPIPKSLEFLVNVNYTNHILKPEHKIDVRNTTQTEPFRMTHSSIRTNSP